MFDDLGNLLDEQGNIVPGSDYGNEGIGKDPISLSERNDTNYGNEGNNVPPPDAVGKTPDGSSWLDKAGNIIGKVLDNPAVQGALSGIGSNALRNIFSGGAFNEARGNIKDAISGIKDISGADLMSFIPQLQQQVMQGKMDAATAQAALAQVVGQMSPAEMQAAKSQAAQMEAVTGMPIGQMNPAAMQAAQAQVQGKMDAATAEVKNAVMQGKMTPEQAQTALQQASGMAGVKSDEQTIAGQRAALDRLSQIGTQGGMTEADRAQLNATMGATNANTAQQRAAQIQQLQMQGNAGTGAELAARLSGVQGGANTNAMAGASIAQAAQARALQALQANLQGNAALNTQLFGQDAAKAQAQDVVNQFNAAAQNSMNQYNTANRQAAGLSNFTTANQLEAQNANAANAMAQYNAGNQQASNLANFGMANQVGLANAANQQAANQYNAGNQQASNLANFGMANQYGMQNMANQQAANQYNAGNLQAANLANAANQQAANQYNAGNQQASNLANFGMGNQFALANQGAQNTANLANAGYQQGANLSNFNTANQIAGTNVGIQNQQAMLPLQTAQQSFQNRLGQGTAAANAGLTGAHLLNTQGNIQANAALGAMGATGRSSGTTGTTGTGTSGGSSGGSSGGGGSSGIGSKLGGAVGTVFGGPIGSVIGSIGGGLLDSIFSDEDLKTDKKELTDDEVDNMFGKLTAYKYRYKGAGNKETQGVMAQDIEKTPMRQSVVDTPAGKMLSGDEMLGQSMAALANLSQRIRKLEGK